jgi:hypothetical protein
MARAGQGTSRRSCLHKVWYQFVFVGCILTQRCLCGARYVSGLHWYEMRELLLQVDVHAIVY